MFPADAGILHGPRFHEPLLQISLEHRERQIAAKPGFLQAHETKLPMVPLRVLRASIQLR